MAVAVALPILGALGVSGAYVLGLISASADFCTTLSKIPLKSRGCPTAPLAPTARPSYADPWSSSLRYGGVRGPGHLPKDRIQRLNFGPT